ncbi:MAG TPA: hypothetical protein VIX42_03400, partial [Edaphobacter sp.]
ARSDLRSAVALVPPSRQQTWSGPLTVGAAAQLTIVASLSLPEPQSLPPQNPTGALALASPGRPRPWEEHRGQEAGSHKQGA